MCHLLNGKDYILFEQFDMVVHKTTQGFLIVSKAQQSPICKMHLNIVIELFAGEDEKTETLEPRGGGGGGDKRSDKQWKCQGEEEGGGEEVQSDQSGQSFICGLAVSGLDNWLVAKILSKSRTNILRMHLWSTLD